MVVLISATYIEHISFSDATPLVWMMTKAGSVLVVQLG